MKSLARVLVALVIFTGVGIAAYSWLNATHPGASPALPTQSPPPQIASPSPSNHYPVPAEAEEASGDSQKNITIANLAESDSTIEDALIGLFGKNEFDSFFNPKNIVRRFVVTIDNLTKHDQPSHEYSPLVPLERGFKVKGKGDERSIDPSNFTRYAPYVKLLGSVSSQKLVSVYVHFYPLFQHAYEELGTRGYFNDRLVEVIDTLLGTPEVKEPIYVVQTGSHKIYKYADDELESLPSAQRIMIRMGSENETLIKEKLQELKELLIHLNKKGRHEK